MKLTGATVLCACTGALGISGCSAPAGAFNAPLAPEGSYRRQGNRVILSLIAANELNAEGSAVRLALGDGEDSGVKIIVVHPAEGTYQAFADRCTHRGKELYYLHEKKMLQCRSGKSQFDLEGNIIDGPAESALLVYPSHREGDVLLIEVS